MTAEQAEAAASLLELDEDAWQALRLQPSQSAGDRGAGGSDDASVL